MTLSEVRKRYLEFFAARGHVVIPSAQLVPENDPTTLFTSSGMQPLVPYLLGQPHPEGKRIANSEKCFRADDIDEVGDNRHTTFFEMLGNWSLGDYFKKEQLPWIFEFLTDTREGVGLDPMNIYVTVFAGDSEMEIPADDESVRIWKELFLSKDIDAKYVQLGSEANGSALGMQGGRIFSYDVKKNWWSRAGVPSKMPPGEPGGPDSEIFYEFKSIPHDQKFGLYCHPNCGCGRFLEIGNSVFMEYKKRDDGAFEKLAQRNVDFGGGLERIVAASIDSPNYLDIFHIDVFQKMIYSLREKTTLLELADRKKLRIVLDHIRASVFFIGDGVLPMNKGQGYVLRKLIRRAALFSDAPWTDVAWLERMIDALCSYYKEQYPELDTRRAQIIKEITDEFKKFGATVKEGWKEFERRARGGTITGKDAFDLYQSYGFPWEMTQEIAEEKGINVDKAAFEEEFEKHRDLSRTAAAGTFKGGLADTSEKTIRLHTVHHLLLRALQIVLGPTVKQRGSNITSERLRLDYLHDAKLTDEQKTAVEKIVNEKIAEDLPVDPQRNAACGGGETRRGARVRAKISGAGFGVFHRAEGRHARGPKI